MDGVRAPDKGYTRRAGRPRSQRRLSHHYTGDFSQTLLVGGASARARNPESVNCPPRTPVTHWDHCSPCDYVRSRAVCRTRTGILRRHAAGTAAVPVEKPVANFSRALVRNVPRATGYTAARAASKTASASSICPAVTISGGMKRTT